LNELNRQFSEEVKMANKYMKKCLTPSGKCRPKLYEDSVSSRQNG
jgi:hypothetical protein